MKRTEYNRHTIYILRLTGPYAPVNRMSLTHLIHNNQLRHGAQGEICPIILLSNITNFITQFLNK